MQPSKLVITPQFLLLTARQNRSYTNKVLSSFLLKKKSHFLDYLICFLVICKKVFHAKIKFWGKSMEVHPEGYTRVTLPKQLYVSRQRDLSQSFLILFTISRFNETYQWNKIVMYVHNIMGASRKIEHYGEITIRCTSGVSCTITFPKVYIFSF